MTVYRADLLSPPGEGPQPAPDRVHRPPQPGGNRPGPGPGRLRHQRRPDHLREVHPPDQREHRSTCEPPQPPHRARRGRSQTIPDPLRNTRSRAHPHGASTTSVQGHRWRAGAQRAIRDIELVCFSRSGFAEFGSTTFVVVTAANEIFTWRMSAVVGGSCFRDAVLWSVPKIGPCRHVGGGAVGA